MIDLRTALTRSIFSFSMLEKSAESLCTVSTRDTRVIVQTEHAKRVAQDAPLSNDQNIIIRIAIAGISVKR